MRYILIILVFLSVGAKAQMVIKAHANYRPFVAPISGNLLLDDYPNAAAAYSLRKLDKDYIGNCIRVRRDSVGQTEQDFGFTASGYLDTTAIKNFCRANAGKIVTWYDQSGNGRNISQSTASRQPNFWTGSGFGSLTATLNDVRKSLAFEDIGQMRLINNFSTISQPITTFSVSRIDNSTTGGFEMIYDSYNNTTFALGYTGTTESPNNRWLISSGTGLVGTTAGNTSPNIYTALHNSTSSSIHINGQSYASGNAGTNGLDGISVGNLRGNPNPLFTGYGLDGRIAELIIYGSNQSTNRTAIENNINDYYNIYWNGDFTGILDTYPNSAAAYSLRNLSSTYKGPLIRVRKDTTGQPEIDVYGDYYGNLDTVGLKNFLLTRDGRVVRFYDQSGNGRDATQSTASNQPVIAVNGVINRNPVNNRVSVNFTYDRNHLLQTSNQTFSGNITMFGAYNMYTTPDLITEFAYGIFSYGEESNARRRSLIIWNGGSGSTWYHYGSAFAQNLQIAQATAPTNSLVYSLFNHTSQQISGGYNGGTAVTASRTLTNPAASPIYIGATGSGERLDGNIFELIMYNSNQSSNRTGIESNINSYYSIY